MRITRGAVGWTVGGAAFAAALTAAITFGPVFPTTATEAPGSTVVQETPEPTFTPTPEPVETVAPAPAPEPEAVEAPPAPAQCPSGTEASHVDDAGNESGCIPKNNQGETCQAFNDAGECTAWASGTRRLEPVL